MASVADLARLEGRGSGIENETLQPCRSAALGLELGRGCKRRQTARTCRRREGCGAGHSPWLNRPNMVPCLLARREVLVLRLHHYWFVGREPPILATPVFNSVNS